MKFEDCLLSFSSFFNLKLNGIKFIGCRCERVVFTRADLTKASFSQSDLREAIFSDTIQEKADLEAAFSFSLTRKKTASEMPGSLLIM